MDSDIESRQFMAHANSILELEKAKNSSDNKSDKVVTDDVTVPLARRLDVYFEDKSLLSLKAGGKPNLADFPPPFQVSFFRTTRPKKPRSYKPFLLDCISAIKDEL